MIIKYVKGNNVKGERKNIMSPFFYTITLHIGRHGQVGSFIESNKPHM